MAWGAQCNTRAPELELHTYANICGGGRVYACVRLVRLRALTHETRRAENFAPAPHIWRAAQVMTPFDVVKQRMQMCGSETKYPNFGTCVRCINQVEGATAFYASFRTTVRLPSSPRPANQTNPSHALYSLRFVPQCLF